MPKVFVLLPDTLDAGEWRQRWLDKLAPDESPYGYHQAALWGWEVEFSCPYPRRQGLAALPFKLARRLLGFDLEHAWNNRSAAFARDVSVVWTHTEQEFLPLLWLRSVTHARPVPVIAQIVWLADRWHRLSTLQRRRNRRLLRLAHKCTCHSPFNLTFLQDIVGGENARLVEFGISAELMPSETPAIQMPEAGQSIRLLSIGNDQHRDWSTLRAALRGLTGFDTVVASGGYPVQWQTAHVKSGLLSMPELQERLANCHAVVVPLKHNLHASGLTVILEAIARGKPVIASDTGGLRHYFSDNEVTYVPAGDPQALRAALLDLFQDEQALKQRVAAARQRFITLDLTSAGFVRRHIMLGPLPTAAAP